MNPLSKVNCVWSPSFAYAVGLITTDGYLSSDKRHLEFNSKDKEQVENFKGCLNLNNKITGKVRGGEQIKKYHHIQFGDVNFYKFLESIGLSSGKSKTLQELKIPKKLFPDFLRGVFDGDGCFSTFAHPESKHAQIRVSFTSASPKFLRWLHLEIGKQLHTRGFIKNGMRTESLSYAIQDSLKLLSYMYYSPDVIRLSRKFLKAKPYFMRTW